MKMIVSLLAAAVVAAAVPSGAAPDAAWRELVVELTADGSARVVSSIGSVVPRPVPPLRADLTGAVFDAAGRRLLDVALTDPFRRSFDVPMGQKLSGGPAPLDTADVVLTVPEAARLLRLSDAHAPDRSWSVVLPARVTGARERPPYPVTTLSAARAPTEAVDVVVLGDGYTAAELAKYHADTDTMLSHLFGEAPFRQYAEFFNVHRVEVTSADSGTDDHCAGIQRDTALDTGFFALGVATDCRLLWTYSTAKVRSAAAAAPEADLVLILVNTTQYGGSGGTSFAVGYTGWAGPEVMAHEIGHTFAGLADEYHYGYPGTYRGAEPLEPNVTSLRFRETAKWRDWIDPSTPVPTTGGQPDRPGMYEGARYYEYGMYRPTYDSKMRSLFRPFERVNHQAIVRRIIDVAGGDASAPELSATIREAPTTSSSTITVDIEAHDPESYVLAYQISNHPDFADSALIPASDAASFTATRAWTLLPGPGPRAIFVRALNGAGLPSVRTAATLVLN